MCKITVIRTTIYNNILSDYAMTVFYYDYGFIILFISVLCCQASLRNVDTAQKFQKIARDKHK